MVVMMFTIIRRGYTPHINEKKIVMNFDLLVGGAVK